MVMVMGDRYLVSGAQFALLLSEDVPDSTKKALIESIMETQFVFASDGMSSVDEDAADLRLKKDKGL